MPELEYHSSVRHGIQASVALSGLLLALPLVCIGQVQPPVSVPSPTGSVRPFTGAVRPMTGPVQPPTSAVPGRGVIGSGGYIPNSRVTFSGSKPGRDKDQRHHHRDQFVGQYGAYPLVPYAVAIPYALDDANQADDADSSDDADYQGGPTVFDRRGSGEDSYVPPVDKVPTPHAGGTADASMSTDEAPQVQTLLVFKDGHKLEVGNYAIVGDTLFDLTPGHTRRVALAALDLDATRQQNDDRGVVFQLPAFTQGS
jgi:hypothetical protein